MDSTPCQKADVSVHAKIRAAYGLHVFGPSKSWRINDTLHTAIAGAHDIELDAADFAVFGASNRCYEWVGGLHEILRSVNLAAHHASW
jgi:hypothetical protein